MELQLNQSVNQSDGLSMEMAVQDSPFFREALNEFENDLEEFTKWLELILKSIKTYADDLSSLLTS